MILKLRPENADASARTTSVNSANVPRAAWELILLLSALEWVLWTSSKHVLPASVRTASAVLLFAVVAGLLFFQRPSRDCLGLSPPSWWSGFGWLVVFTILSIALIAAVGAWFGTLGNVEHFGRWVGRTWYVEGAQQLMLQVLLVPRLAVFIKSPVRISVVAGVLFSLLHAPNFPLMGLTLVAGIFWCEWFRRFKNFPALWLSHILLAAAALYCLNGPSLRVLRVGIGYIFYAH